MAGAASNLNKYKERLWKQPVSVWSEFLKAYVDEVTLVGDDGLQINCPFHEDKTPSSTLHRKKKSFKCYAANCNVYTRDPFEFIKAVTGAPSTSEAFSAFKKFTNQTFKIEEEDFNQLELASKKQRSKKILAEITHNYLIDSWTNPPSEKAKKNIEWLRDVRGIRDPHCMQSLGLWPTRAEVERRANEKDSTGETWEWIKDFAAKYFTTDIQERIVFISATSPDNVTSFKFRHGLVPKKDGVSVLKEDDDPIGFFGLLNTAYGDLISDNKIQHCYVVEGEIDQARIFQAQYDKSNFGEVFLCVGGSGHNGLNELEDLGFPRVYIIGDNDDKGEAGFVRELLLKTRKHKHRIFIWPAHLKHPSGQSIDPADAIKQFGADIVYSELVHEDNYISEVEWGLRYAQDKYEQMATPTASDVCDLGVEVAKIFSGDRITINDFAMKFVADHKDVNTQNILDHVLTQGDTPDAFIERLASFIKSKVHILYWEKGGEKGRSVIHMWNPDTKTKIAVPLGGPAAEGLTVFERELCNGKPLKWLKETVGLPGNVADPLDESTAPATRDQVLKRCRGWTIEALEVAANKDEVDYRGAIKPLLHGIHSMGKESGCPVFILINGSNIFKLTYDKNSKELKSVEELESPVYRREDNNTTYECVIDKEHSATWFPDLTSPKELYKKPPLTIEETYQQVYKAVNKLSYSYNHEANSAYLALLAFYAYLSPGFASRKLLTQLKGEAATGKSTLLALLTNKDSEMQNASLVYHSSTITSSTRAGLRNAMKDRSMLMGMDEKNQDDDSRSSQNNSTQDLLIGLRDLATGGKTTHTYSNTEQKSLHATTQCPVVVAGNFDIERDMDLTRFHVIQMRRSTSMRDANVIKRELETHDKIDFDKLRQSIALHSLRLLGKYEEAVLSVEKELEVQLDSLHSREKWKFLPALGVAKLVNQDCADILTKLVKASKDYVRLNPLHNPGDELFDLICNLQIVPTGDSNIPEVSFIYALRRQHLKEQLINSAEQTGLFFDELESRLVVDWNIVSVLPVYKMNRNLPSPRRAVKIASESKYAISDFNTKDTSSGLVNRLQARGLNLYGNPSAFNVAHLVDDANKNQASDAAQLNNEHNLDNDEENIIPEMDL